MKFSSALKFNAVADCSPFSLSNGRTPLTLRTVPSPPPRPALILSTPHPSPPLCVIPTPIPTLTPSPPSHSYDALKKTIYHLEKQQHEQLSQSHHLEATTARSAASRSPLRDRPYRDLEANLDGRGEEAQALIQHTDDPHPPDQLFRSPSTSHRPLGAGPGHGLGAEHGQNLLAPQAANTSPLQNPTGPNAVFVPLLDKELRKIVSFYEMQARELEDAVAELEEEVEEQDRVWVGGRAGGGGARGERGRYRDNPEEEEDEYGDDEEGRRDDYVYRYGDGEEDGGLDNDDDSVSRSPVDRRRRGGPPRSASRKSGSRGPSAAVAGRGGRRRQDSLTVPGAGFGLHGPSAHRSSFSSSDGGVHGLDESVYSTTAQPTDAGTATVVGSSFAPGAGAGHRRDGTATSALGKITNKITAMKDSMTSSMFLGDAGPSNTNAPSLWTANSDYAYDMRLLFKRKITNLFVVGSNLKSYVEVNYSGFRKVLKKYDKVLDCELQQPYLTTRVSLSLPFTPTSKAHLTALLTRLIDLYTRCVVRGDISLAKQQLRLHVRENIAWERDTVWRQMINAERRGEGRLALAGNGGGVGGRGAGAGDGEDEDEAGLLKGIGSVRVESDDEFEQLFDSVAGGGGGAGADLEARGASNHRTRSRSGAHPRGGVGGAGTKLKVGGGRRPNVLIEWESKRFGRGKLTKKKAWMIASMLFFVALLNVETIKLGQSGEDGEVEVAQAINRCFAVLMFCTVMWATEAVPLFVTSMSVPLLLVLLKVIRKTNEDGSLGEVLGRPEATKYIFSIMFSPTIMLLIGGFTISSALSKTNIDKVIITRVLSLAGSKPSMVLLTFMGVSCFASMWISNVAAPTLCFTLIKPILRTIPPKSSFGPCLILAIALAANIGGQSSPISSPQNLIAISYMEPKPSWAAWFAVALPVSFLSIVLIWLLLLITYNPSRHPDPTEGYIEIKAIRPTREKFTVKQWWVTIVCVVTIGLWCVAHQIESVIGDMGIVALIPIVAFFSTGVLKKDDFDQFMWTIVFLAMGGIALGKGVVQSGLLEVLDGVIKELIDGFDLYTVVLIFSPIVLIISTFISHTIASVLLAPIAQQAGRNLGGHENILVFITALICSAGMGMPVSGFPNQTAATQEDELGELYLSNVDFLRNGVPASMIATLVIATVGFALMKAIGI
ncbi:hypothetical protein AX16_007284 [Volvariella volvacea WC 439]|nr:hypothetical protein AX16_007284 [Volvariella volvacea WC 439]